MGCQVFKGGDTKLGKKNKILKGNYFLIDIGHHFRKQSVLKIEVAKKLFLTKYNDFFQVGMLCMLVLVKNLSNYVSLP